ncbi:prolipoprotein diacylglyceryl transferase [Rehaibacterium terrae]|jgi:phosphatidylglycerol:prolipoprotein diacylglycerol transferase|uniref:Phosphatidylglycerol--prolipoprotein diacylglyceryl transferase n=1 Tax=Rehaibacterium terrae TaxID=1341696 RepID=A0A7W7Y285_9GAMM|nr:prolipoprotein diacylglyceryl transferase [Rehaibacterium terrae]MBB5016498.1 phosphatidylglycerol:prolipoprotein diacylglycerol transferase [Rehaibacterium terrae]
MSWLHDIDPIAIPLPFWPHGIHWYGLMYVAGFLVAWWLGTRRVNAGRLPGVDANGWGDLMFYAMLGVILGGRLGYVLFYGFGDFLRDPLMLLRIHEGGMSFHGGLLGVMAAVAWWSWRRRLHVFDTLDFVAPLVPPGLGFGRLGNFIGGELWGKPTGGQGGVVFPDALPPELARLDLPTLRELHQAGALEEFARYPSQLYQAGLEGLAMFVVLYWFSRKPRPRYAVSGLFALLYGVFRFAVEFVREPDAHIGYLAWGWLTMGQVLSLPLVAVGIVLLGMSRRAPTLRPAGAA